MRSARPILCLALAGVALGAADDPKAEKSAYLGVATSNVTATLAEQLGLPPGVGVAIDAVDTASPADLAGLRAHDVVTRLDEQWVVNVQQFGVLVRMHRGGDTVTLGVVRRGRPTTVPVRLGERTTPEDDIVRGPLLSMIRHTDGEHAITVVTHADGGRRATIIDRQGKLIYDGTLNTAADADRLPPGCGKKIDAILRNFEQYKQLRATTRTSR